MGSIEKDSATGSWSWRCTRDLYTPRDAANLRRCGAWLMAWTISFSFMTVILGKHLVTALPLAIPLAVLPTLLGIATVTAFVRFLRDADELLRKVHVEALGWGFGVGAVFMLGYRLFERIGAPKLDISDPIVVMMFAAAIAQMIAWRRYL